MEYRLEELFDLQMGKTPSRSVTEYWESGNNKWISIADLSKCGKYIYDTKECLSDIAVSESGIKQIPANTVVMSFKLSIGKTAITSEPMYSNEAIMSFRDRKLVQLLPEYIYYLLLSENWDDGTNKAVMGKTLNKATLSKVKVNIHSMQEQQEIVYVLNQATALIELHQQQLQKLDELIKARFVEMFGDPLLDDGRYCKAPLGCLAQVGSSKRIFEKEYVSEGIPFYRTKEIVELSNGNKISTELFITPKRYNEIRDEYGVPQAGDLLISAVGTIGVIWIVDGKNDFYFKDGNLLRVANSDNFMPVYLKCLLETLICAHKSKMSSGTAYAALTISTLKEMSVYKVPLAEQSQFSTFVSQVDKSKLQVPSGNALCIRYPIFIEMMFLRGV